MKILIFLFLFTITTMAAAKPPVIIKLTWKDPNPSSMLVTKYNIYQYNKRGGYFSYLTSVNTNYVSIVIPSNEYYRWKVSAVNMWGESLLSSESRLIK